jgi:hypothetical protein
MSVVLPAPLAPTRPNTEPRGTVRLTSSRAVLEPNRRVKPLIVMMLCELLSPLAIMFASYSFTSDCMAASRS